VYSYRYDSYHEVVMRITAKGQVTIPIEIREQFGLLPDTEVDFVVDKGIVTVVPRASDGDGGRGRRAVRNLRRTGTVRMTTDEILALTRKP
jgi:AbrB family looped-hinge helix DNA binding protein